MFVLSFLSNIPERNCIDFDVFLTDELTEKPIIFYFVSVYFKILNKLGQF